MNQPEGINTNKEHRNREITNRQGGDKHHSETQKDNH